MTTCGCAFYCQVVLDVNGEDQLTFAFAYGFRNIQNIVQKIKRKKCNYQFVEIMACPSGCINGGGQAREDSRDGAIQLLQDAEKLYKNLPSVVAESCETVVKLSEELEHLDENDREKLLRTEYKAIEKNVTALSIKW